MTRDNGPTWRRDILFDNVRAIMNMLDPLGLVTQPSAEDEYDAQVSGILSRLREARSPEDVRDIVKAEFARWFDADLIRGWEPTDEAVESIWHEWERYSADDG